MKKMFYSILTTLLLISLLSFNGCASKPKVVTKTGFYFDTAITITLYNEKSSYIDKCFKLCEKYENMFSNKIVTSDISKINNNSKECKSTNVSSETLELINKGITYGNLSGGKFDITIGALSNLWAFSSDEPSVPQYTDIQNALATVNYKNIIVNNNTIMLSNKNAVLDLGGIAKGYIADKLKEYLESEGIESGIINLGGNVLLLGTKTDGSNYNIGIQKPFGGENDKIAVINLNNKSIVTSGVYERYFYQDDVMYHHILDINTGFPIENNILSVTIISDKSVDGDALSTTTFSLGLKDGMNLIESIPDTEAVFIDDNYEIHLSSGLNINANNNISIK